MSDFDRGPLLVNYVGHGSVEIWREVSSNPRTPTISRNGLHLPLAIAMTCLNGFFQDASAIESLAEALLKAPKGERWRCGPLPA